MSSSDAPAGATAIETVPEAFEALEADDVGGLEKVRLVEGRRAG
jgi:hypothetical protein